MKSQINPLPAFFDRYINLVDEENLIIALEQSLETFVDYDLAALESLGDKTYQENKWTVKEILQHVIDNERIQSYRALRFARNDKTSLPGYNEELLAQYSNAHLRTISDLREEFAAVRRSSLVLFKRMDPEAMQRIGVCNDIEISALGLGFAIVGHQIHHFKVIEELYLPLMDDVSSSDYW